MAAEGSGDSGAPNLNLTPDEKRVYGQLFRQADTDNVGVVTGEVAVKFFERTRLDSRILGEVWQIADKENRGFLTPAGFSIALRLIAHSQAGREPSPEIALQPGPIPRLEGFTPTPAPLSTQVTGQRGPPAPLQAQGTGGPIRIPPLMPDRVAQYTTLFERQGLQTGGMLPGDQARSIFEKSGLPNEILGRIWQLADTEQRGALVLTEFIIAMHLLTSTKSGQLPALPNMVPAALYEAATRRGSPIMGGRQQSPTATGGFAPIPRQLSGQAGMRAGSPLGRPPMAAQQTGQNWLVSPQEKARTDTFFNKLDEAKKGYITGEEAVAFFSQSNLPEDTLAQIWDLADVKSEGTLNSETFAVAMHLISQTRGKRDGPAALPATLPPNLIPPSMRNQMPAPQPAPAPPKPVSAMDDLMGLDAFSSPAAPVQTATATGGSTATDPFASAPTIPGSPSRASPTVSGFGKPFVPTSGFGLSLSNKPASESTTSIPSFSRPIPQQQTRAAAVEDDLLGDNDADVSSKLNNETTELANISNQINSLTTHMQEVQVKRGTTQNDLNQANTQKKNFEQRLTQLRALYDKEAQDVKALEEQLRTSRSETGKLAGELASVESTYHELQKQHQQFLTALQADQQENNNLKERIKTVNNEVAQIKPQIEKLKSDARQHKGLVAINKKQLATVEGERDKLKTEAEDLTRSNEELTRQLSMSPPPAAVASPALSATSGNNPFFKRTGSTDIMGAFASPPAKNFNDKSFDDIFGPSAPPQAPAPAFQAQNTGASTGSATSFATPATSNTPTISRQATLAMEPPAPPISRQMSSSILPFGETAESLTSSRQVSPPLSRSGAPEPAFAPAKPLEPTATGQSLASATSGADSAADAFAFPPVEKITAGTGGAAPASSTADDAKSPAGHARGDSVNDPFSAMDQAKAKEDFESAFASFKNTKAKAAEPSGTDAPKSFSNFNTEFPPISELERDDDSESDSDRGGFDDDFAPVSPQPKAGDKADASKAPSSTLDKAATSTEAAPASASAAVDAGNPFGAARENPESSKGTTSIPLAKSAEDDLFGSTSSKPETLQTSAPAPASAKAPFDDSDDDFDGLEDAKEGSADDDFATISRSGLDDYNPVFDSSPPQSHVAKSDSNMTGATAPFGAESSFDFASLGSSTGGSAAGIGGSPAVITQNNSAAGSSGSKGAQAPDAQDWDAIFSTLDEAAPAPAAAATTASESTETAAKAAERPTPGRALTEEGKHDDPILKNLTGMGYSRKDALSALEKYDYNLERAANFLASQS